MSLKQEIESWVEALKYYDEQDYDAALKVFEKIADTSKIWFNIGMIHATLGDHDKAIEAYKKATKLDQFLAVAYFQQGVSNFLLLDYQEALANFNEALLYLRGNTLIDYEQLGLKFRLYSCEVLFNRGLCYIYSGQEEEGMSDLNYASKEKQIDDHKVIDEAIAERAVDYTVFSIPVGVVYKPNEAKVRNVKQKDYLGKARLVAATDRANAFTGFAGVEVKKTLETVQPADDRKPTEMSFAASNLVKTDLISSNKIDPATGQQVGQFPPTPPPEKDMLGRGNSLKGPPAIAQRSMSQRAGPSARQERFDTARDNRSDYAREQPRERDQRDDYAGGPPRRGQSTRDVRRPDRQYVPQRAASTTSSSRSRPPRDTPSRNARRQPPIDEYSDGADDYDDEIYDFYRGEPDRGSRRTPSISGSKRGASRRGTPRDRYIEEDEYASEAYEGSSLDEGEFEMVSRRSGGSTRRSESRRQPSISKIKVKCHNGDDTRVIMISVDQDFNDFMQRLKDKFGFKKNMKCKVKDEDDSSGMISLFDQEDLDMQIENVKAEARRQRLETGKLEVWVFDA